MRKNAIDPLVMRAHIAELEALRDALLLYAKMGHADAREQVVMVHKIAMEKRDRLRGNGGYTS